MKFCPHCGRSGSDNARYCMSCGFCFDPGGAPLRAAPVAVPPQPRPQPQPQARPSAPRLDPALVETASSDLYALQRHEVEDSTASTVGPWQAAPTAPQQPPEDDNPRMSPRVWNTLLFGGIGLAVIALLCAVIFYLSNQWL